MSAPTAPIAPPDPEPHALAGRVRAALYALPAEFESDLTISGIRATDLHAFNTALGATVEEQVVTGLNALRSVTWDAKEELTEYRFERQPQTFPDVVLRAQTPDKTPEILMGIELKGWYALAKEREPSFRYRVTPEVCAPEDLLVVYPWALDRVLSGSPELFPPFVVQARYAAEYRNWHWAHVTRDGGPSGQIKVSQVTDRYPTKNQLVLDEPADDRGGNFGRFARTGLMDEYISRLFERDLMGIPLDAWQRFLKIFSEQSEVESINRALDHLAAQASGRGKRARIAQLEQLKEGVVDLATQLEALEIS